MCRHTQGAVNTVDYNGHMFGEMGSSICLYM